MRLTRYTDYAIRVLLHLAAHEDQTVSIQAIARAYGISKDHLMKVVQQLSKAGFVTAQRGRGGGLRLGRPASEIRIGDVVRETEDGFQLVDCGSCKVAPVCGLPRALNEATTAFLAVLDAQTLDKIVADQAAARRLLALAS
ncbi:Rrf2 family transcriptional regulator [Caulobacter sp. 1776]|uniref:Rrf2 family transcriptional regulator n=1 Tax=Caulobacter sp. 1776 TaxID=3156420 RepID=UPI003398C85E